MKNNFHRSQRNKNQHVAQYSLSFVIKSATCFGQIYWPPSGRHTQRCIKLNITSCG